MSHEAVPEIDRTLPGHWKEMSEVFGRFSVYSHFPRTGACVKASDIDFVSDLMKSCFGSNLSLEDDDGSGAGSSSLEIPVWSGAAVGGAALPVLADSTAVSSGLQRSGAAAGGAALPVLADSTAVSSGLERSGAAGGNNGGGSGKFLIVKRLKTGVYAPLPKTNFFDLTWSSDDEHDVDPGTTLRLSKRKDQGLVKPPLKQSSVKTLGAKMKILQTLIDHQAEKCLHVVEIEQIQNKSSLFMQRLHSQNHELGDSGLVRVYHGSAHKSLQSIVGEGLSGKFGKRKAYGPGIYLTPDFNIALGYARNVSDANGNSYVLVLQYQLGRIKQIRYPGDHTFDDGAGGFFNTKEVRSEKYYIASNDSQVLLTAIVAVKHVDKVVVETAAMKQAALAAAEQLEQDRQTRLQNAREAAQKWQDGAQERQKRFVEAQELLDIERTKHKERILQQKKESLPPSNTNLQDSGAVRLHDSVMLQKMFIKHRHLNNEMGIVRLIVRETERNGGKTFVMVELYNAARHAAISQNNVKNETRLGQTGYSRYGDNMRHHYFICNSKQIERDSTTKAFDEQRKAIAQPATYATPDLSDVKKEAKCVRAKAKCARAKANSQARAASKAKQKAVASGSKAKQLAASSDNENDSGSDSD